LRLFDQQGTQVIKAQLIDRVAAGNTHLRPGDASKTVNIILEVITAALARGDRVEMRGIGTFSVRVRRGRPARNPKNGAEVIVPERRFPHFKAGRRMHDRLNEGAVGSLSPRT
jgi:integration host factor subunit beta